MTTRFVLYAVCLIGATSLSLFAAEKPIGKPAPAKASQTQNASMPNDMSHMGHNMPDMPGMKH